MRCSTACTVLNCGRGRWNAAASMTSHVGYRTASAARISPAWCTGAVAAALAAKHTHASMSAIARASSGDGAGASAPKSATCSAARVATASTRVLRSCEGICLLRTVANMFTKAPRASASIGSVHSANTTSAPRSKMAFSARWSSFQPGQRSCRTSLDTPADKLSALLARSAVSVPNGAFVFRICVWARSLNVSSANCGSACSAVCAMSAAVSSSLFASPLSSDPAGAQKRSSKAVMNSMYSSSRVRSSSIELPSCVLPTVP
mmetsp:Transcript_24154/g.74773  ORF Transcript_24154/g.74773 Transcript_24154/m.74773 type:complete len:262 (-) Transcript_24154:947-1732(-)